MKPEKITQHVLKLCKQIKISSPIIYDSPHSGIIFPRDFRTTAPDSQLNTAIDAFVDELIIENSNLGTAVLIADFPRLY